MHGLKGRTYQLHDEFFPEMGLHHGYGITAELLSLRARWYSASSKVTSVDCKPFEEARSQPSPIHLEAGLVPNGSVAWRNAASASRGLV
jgi:hypothetical protein